MYAYEIATSQATRWPVQATAVSYLLLVLLIVPGPSPAACRQPIRGRKLNEVQAAAAAANNWYFPPEAAISSHTGVIPIASTLQHTTGNADVALDTGSGSTSTSTSSSTNAASSQPLSYTGGTLAANTYTRTFKHPCSYTDVCRHNGRCLPYGWTFTCVCAAGWGGWYCERPVAARNTLLAVIPSVPHLAPQPGYSSGSTLTEPLTTLPARGYTTNTPSNGTPSGVTSGIPASSAATTRLASSADINTGSPSGSVLVYNAAMQPSVLLPGDAGAAAAVPAWPTTAAAAAAAAAAARPLTSDTSNFVKENAPRVGSVGLTPGVVSAAAAGEGPRLNGGSVNGYTGDTGVAAGIQSASAAAGTNASSAGVTGVNGRPPIIGVVAPVG